MKRIRIGKDISLRWEITTDGMAIPLEGRDLMVEIKSPMSVVSNIPFRVDGNTIIMTYYGTEQKSVGEHSVTLWENKGKPGQNVVDSVKAFKLVKTSPEEDDFANGDIQVETIDLGTANLDVMIGPATPGESPDLSALKEQVNANTTSISKINEELDNKDSEIAQINTTLEEHTNSINATSDIVSSHTSEISAINSTLSSHTNELDNIKTKQTEQNNSISQINNTLADHEERFVYTESDLVKIRKEYDSIISELIKSIGHTQKAFVVETNDNGGNIYIDNVKMNIPANTIKAFRFNNKFRSVTDGNSGIVSFRFLVTDTSEMESMNLMFATCSSLTSLDLSSFVTEDVTDISNMFSGCTSITSLDLSSFVTENVTDMNGIFYQCSSLTSIDISSFNTHAVTIMTSMFQGCIKLTSIDVTKFDTSVVTSMRGMFAYCKNLTSLDLSSFDTSALTDATYMFSGCTSLASILLGPNFFKTSAVTSIDFLSCSKWTNDTVITSLVTNSYDRATAGLNTLTLQLPANTKAVLTDEQKATITSKGYTIA